MNALHCMQFISTIRLHLKLLHMRKVLPYRRASTTHQGCLCANAHPSHSKTYGDPHCTAGCCVLPYPLRALSLALGIGVRGNGNSSGNVSSIRLNLWLSHIGGWNWDTFTILFSSGCNKAFATALDGLDLFQGHSRLVINQHQQNYE